MTACGDAPSGPEEVTPPFGAVSGRVFSPGISTFGDITARITWSGQNLTAPVASDGTFRVEIPNSVGGFGTLTLEPGLSEPVHPGWVLLTPGDVGEGEGTVILAPRSWTIASGDYAGTEVPIDPELAADSRVLPSFWGFYFPFSQTGFLQTVTDDSAWAAEIRSWPTIAFPLPVALDRVASHEAFTATDSVALWEHLDRMEAALGFDAFEPVRLEDLQIEGGSRRALGGVLVQVDTTLSVRAVGRISRPDPQTYSLSADARTWSGSTVQDFQITSADITYGIVGMDARDFIQDRQLVIHEMMHILGAGHGCSWASVQTYCASLVAPVPTAPDVAHLAVMSAMRGLELEHRSRWGVLASVFGHRVVTLGLSPIPSLSVTYGPISAPSDFRKRPVPSPRRPGVFPTVRAPLGE